MRRRSRVRRVTDRCKEIRACDLIERARAGGDGVRARRRRNGVVEWRVDVDPRQHARGVWGFLY